MKSGVSSFPEKSADDGNLKNLRREREREVEVEGGGGGKWRKGSIRSYWH